MCVLRIFIISSNAATHNKNNKIIARIDNAKIMGLFNRDTSFAMGPFNYTQYFGHSQGFEYDKIFSVRKMISYKPFYETLFKKGITEYYLIFKQGFSANTLHRIKKGEAISTKTLDALCFALECDVSDIIKFEIEEN